MLKYAFSQTYQIKHQIKIKNFNHTRCITSKRGMSLRSPSPRHCARATQLLSKKNRGSGETLATLSSI